MTQRGHDSPAAALGVWGHFHGGNLGDELVVSIIIDAIRRRQPGAQIVAVSMAPGDTMRRHGVPTLAINPGATLASSGSGTRSGGGPQARTGLKALARRAPGGRHARTVLIVLRRLRQEPAFLVRSYRSLRSLDRLVVTGSGQLLDAWRGPWDHPLTTFRWALLSRLSRTPVLYPSVGAGPITARLSALMIRKAVDWGAFVSVRDHDSAGVLHAIGVRRDLPVCPDMGWAYDVEGAEYRDRPATPTVVGVNVMSHEDPRYWPRGDRRRYEAYLAKMATFVTLLLEDHHAVVLFSSQTRADRRVAQDLRELLSEQGLNRHPGLEWRVDETETVEDLLETVARCDFVVAARFHSVLLPLALGIPTIGLAYHPKTSELLDQVGRPSWCLDIDRFEVSDLAAAFAKLRLEDTPLERAATRERAAMLRGEVEVQFDELFGPRPDQPR